MVTVPCTTPPATPVLEFTVAIAGLLLPHAPPVDVFVNEIVVPPTHIGLLPAIAAGVAFTVAVTVAALPQPFA